MVKHRNTYRNENGMEVGICAKAECRSVEEQVAALAFAAQSSRRFYLELAEKISRELRGEQTADEETQENAQAESAPESEEAAAGIERLIEQRIEQKLGRLLGYKDWAIDQNRGRAAKILSALEGLNIVTARELLDECCNILDLVEVRL